MVVVAASEGATIMADLTVGEGTINSTHVPILDTEIHMEAIEDGEMTGDTGLISIHTSNHPTLLDLNSNSMLHMAAQRGNRRKTIMVVMARIAAGRRAEAGLQIIVRMDKAKGPIMDKAKGLIMDKAKGPIMVCTVLRLPRRTVHHHHQRMVGTADTIKVAWAGILPSIMDTTRELAADTTTREVADEDGDTTDILCWLELLSSYLFK